MTLTSMQASEMTAPIRVLVCDDSAPFVEAVGELLSESEGFEIVGTVGDGEAAVQAALEMRPDVVLMDMSMPRRSGIDATEAILAEWGEARIIAVSAYAHNVYLKRFRAARARGFMSKDHVHQDLVNAIRQVHAGDRWFSLGGPAPASG